MDFTELNDFLRLVFNDEHPTINTKQTIRKADYIIESCKSSREKFIRASKNGGLSFLEPYQNLLTSQN